MAENKVVSKIDKEYFGLLRDHVSEFIKSSGKKLDSAKLLVLDIAPQDHEGAKPYFPKAKIETLDIDPSSKSTYIADICKNNSKIIKSNKFDIIVCTEVLEHTLNPFEAVKEIHRILKPGGIVLASVPFNFRIHGPLPDCWRFTEHGLRVLFDNFEILELYELTAEGRFLMPIHYNLTAKKHG